MKKIITLFIIIIGSVGFANAQNNIKQELVTDRPDQTESAFTVPKGFLQIETGILSETDETDVVKEKINALNTTLFRFGLLDNWELRFGYEYLDYTYTDKLTSSEISFNGSGPLVIGTKILIAEEDGYIPQLAFLGHLTLPGTGKDEFETNYLAPDFRFALEYTISEQISFGANIGTEWDSSHPRSNNFYSFVLGIGILENLGMFLESYGYIIEKSDPDHRVDFGITYSILDNLQLDASAGLGINDLAPDSFISAGLSYRLPE